MGHIIGIDLGTTYSAVAIPETRLGEGFFAVRECPGYSVVLDRLKNRITPSVVAEDEKGEIVVGHRAKGRAGLSPEPIMFAKRSMGEDVVFSLNRQGTLRPEDVSAHVLRYLKKLAEDRLGEPVDEAVITVPAYFTLRAKQMTEKAGELAGLRVSQIAQEPVAAAMMYCLNEVRDPLRIMTYDLGGGTFDIAIVEKRDGLISTDSILAFDGDRFLGGYNFDKKLAFWLAEQLTANGYELKLDLTNPADKVIFSKLMVFAERIKIALSKEQVYSIQEPATGISDHGGNPVAIDLSITRDDFEKMIARDVEYTIELCHRAMSEKANPPILAETIDEIIMVGGSSRIPLVGRRLEEAFGRKPRLVEPDLCVALGAAILAGTKGRTYGCLKLDPIPAETDLPSLTVTGRVVAGGGVATAAGCGVLLRALDGSVTKRQTAGTDGAFVFDGVPLAEEASTEFVLKVTEPGGREVGSHGFTVKQSQLAKTGGIVEPVTNQLSKPIGIVLVEGFRVIAPERTPLPYETVQRAKTMDTSGNIRVPIQEGNNPLGEIVMKDIPSTLPVGSAVEVTIAIQDNYQIRGRAFVPAIAREAKVVIDIPVPVLKTIDELRRDLEQLSARAEDAASAAGRGAKFGGGKAKRLQQRLQEAKEMLSCQDPEPAHIQDRLDEINNLVQELGSGWRPEPPRSLFDEHATGTRNLIEKAVKKRPEIGKDGYDKRLDAIVAEGSKAFGNQNAAAWKDAFGKLVKLHDEVEGLLDKGTDDGPPPDPAAILMALARELSQLERTARDLGRHGEFSERFKELAEGLKSINPRAQDAMIQIRDWYLTKFKDLETRLHAPGTGMLGL
jgi:actin-like ATPase involved in cell morphogenesis